MKAGIIIVLVLLVAAFSSVFLLADPGTVTIDFRDYRLEMTVPILVAAILTLGFAIWTIRWIILAPKRLGEAAGRLRSGRAGQKLVRGMIEVAEGNFARGEKLLGRAASSSDAPLFNYLQAARAAHLQGNDQRRDEWLKIAYEESPGAANAVLLTQAEFQLDARQFELALATLRRLDDNSRNHAYALSLLGKIYYRLEDWTNLAEILPRVQKHSQLDKKTLEKWALRVHREALKAANDSDSVAKAYSNIPNALSRHERLLDEYVLALIRVGEHDKAEKELASALNKQWSASLIHTYGLVESSSASNQLKKAERWLGKHPEDADLLLTAARLCLRNELWGKARSYLESVISIRPTPEAYQVYGRLLNQMGDADAAAEAFKQGLGLVAAEPLTALPHLTSDEK